MVLIFLLIIAALVFFVRARSPRFKGKAGERRVSSHLRRLDNEKYAVLNDVPIIGKDGMSHQIDHVVVSLYGIFVIETKNYRGWIFGNEKAEYWRQVIFGNKHQFGNPVKQNWSHVFALKEILCDYPRLPYFPIVVFAGSATLKNIESAMPVVYAQWLLQEIKPASKNQVLTKSEMDAIAAKIQSANISGRAENYAHIQNVRQHVSQAQLKKANLICPHCNAPLALRHGKYRDFYGCTNYPRCRFTMKA